jgi:hypothetical protein
MLLDGRFSGVIDNCYFYHNTSQYLIGMRHKAMHGLADANGLTKTWGDHAWTEASDPETANAIYMEDNTYEKVGSGYSTICDASEGAKVTVRYNTFIGREVGVQFHGTGDMGRGTIFSNVYNNTWTNSQSGNIGVVLAGTGVVANNVIPGTSDFGIGEHRAGGAYLFPACNGSYANDGNTPGESGWPCMDQIGRGPGGPSGNNNVSAPFYFWNNGAMTVSKIDLANQDKYLKKAGDTPAHTGGAVDYVVGTPKPGWTPYSYPHPVRQTGDSAAPIRPQGLQITPQ